MAFDNLPDDWSQRAFDAYFGGDVEELEYCPTCGAGPDEACERACLVLSCNDEAEDEMIAEVPDEVVDLWLARSELFAPPMSDYHGD